MAARYLINPELLRPYNGVPLHSHIRRYYLLPELDGGASKQYAINLQRAFGSLGSKLKHAYREPVHDIAIMRKQDEEALLAFANFLDQIEPDGLRHAADRFAMFAQSLRDINNGIRRQYFLPTAPNRGDQTEIWIARLQAVRGYNALRRSGYSRQKAAEFVAEQYPDLKGLITETGPRRSKTLEAAIVSWARDFSREEVKNPVAKALYKRKASVAPTDNNDQREGEAEAHRLLQDALRLLQDALHPSAE